MRDSVRERGRADVGGSKSELRLVQSRKRGAPLDVLAHEVGIHLDCHEDQGRG